MLKQIYETKISCCKINAGKNLEIVQKRFIIAQSYFFNKMTYLNQTYEILNGGYYSGNSSWDKTHSEIDNCFKLYQLTQGECHICDQEQDFKLEEGNLYFINGSKLLRQFCNHSFSTHWLHFIPKDLILYQGLLTIPTVVQLPVCQTGISDIVPYLEELFLPTNTSLWETSLRILHVQTWLQTSLVELFTQYPVDRKKISLETSRIEPAIKYMNKHYKETVKLEHLAEQCYMSPNYFHKIFKKALNITPTDYLNRIRMNEAIQLLAEKQQTIKNIAYELGFSDDSHFCRSFKKHYGISPGEFQKNKGDILF